MITKEQVVAAQNEWGAGVVRIGSLKNNRTECESFTSDFLDKLYSFENGPVLFKPTKCEIEQFRPTKGKRNLILLQETIALAMKIRALQLTHGPRFVLKTLTSFLRKIVPLRWAITISQILMETRLK